MRKTIGSLAALAITGFLVTLAVGQPPATAPRPAPAATAGEEQAIRQAAAAYSAAFNKADVQGIANFWSPDAEYIDEAGTVYTGRDNVAALFRKYLTDLKGAQMNLAVKSVRLVRPEVAIGEGVSEIKTPDGTVNKGRFIAAWVKTDGRWVLTSARDLPSEEDTAAAASPLKPLEWLVGDWQTADKEGTTTMSCRPALNNAFLQ
jgi:uncharacterized protein (TIGR02246 family)